MEQIGENSKIAGNLDRRAPGGSISVGRDCLIEAYVVAQTDDSQVLIGDNVFIGNLTVIDCALSLVIEDDVLISYGCIVADHDAHSPRYSIRRHDLANHRRGSHDWSHVAKAPVRIGKGAWVGAHAIVLKGVTIGEGAIVGAGAVVTRDVPPWTVAAGNPAVAVRVLGEFDR